jgi:hypothetical protein
MGAGTVPEIDLGQIKTRAAYLTTAFFVLPEEAEATFVDFLDLAGVILVDFAELLLAELVDFLDTDDFDGDFFDLEDAVTLLFFEPAVFFWAERLLPPISRRLTTWPEASHVTSS